MSCLPKDHEWCNNTVPDCPSPPCEFSFSRGVSSTCIRPSSLPLVTSRRKPLQTRVSIRHHREHGGNRVTWSRVSAIHTVVASIDSNIIHILPGRLHLHSRLRPKRHSPCPYVSCVEESANLHMAQIRPLRSRHINHNGIRTPTCHHSDRSEQ